MWMFVWQGVSAFVLYWKGYQPQLLCSIWIIPWVLGTEPGSMVSTSSTDPAMTASIPKPLQVWSFSAAPLAHGHSRAPGTAAPVDAHSLAVSFCKIHHPASILETQALPLLSVISICSLTLTLTLRLNVALVRLAQTHIPSVPPWEAETEWWQIHLNSTLTAGGLIPSVLKKLQSRQQRSLEVLGYVRDKVFEILWLNMHMHSLICCMRVCLTLLQGGKKCSVK